MRAAGRAAWREVMAYVRYVACALLLLCPNALSRHDDDFAFDNSDEFQVELNANHSEIAKNGLRRLWGVPDTSAYVGHLFRIEIPKEAFTAPVVSYKIRSNDGRHVPSWLAVDSRHGLISGLPQTQDLGTHTFTVIAQGRTQGLTATDSFSIEVKKAEAKPHSKYGTCVGSENRLVLTILIDGAFHQIPPRQRIRALMQLASFMALDGDEFSMEPYKTTSRDQPAILSGVGSSKRTHGDATTAIYLNVGCGTRVWSRQRVLLAGVREQARDGTLAHVLRLPVLGWRLVPRTPPRRKRQSPVDDGSGDYDDMYDDEDDFDGEYSGWGDDDDKDLDLDDNIDTAETVDKVKITAYSEASSEAPFNASREPISPRIGHSPIFIYPVSEDLPTTTETEETVASSEGSSTIFGRTTETVTFAMPINQAPTLKHHMKKLAITAGKAFRYIIPADLFTDPEDGTNLTFTMYESEKKLGNNSWIQFIPTQREVYGLPLEEHVSRWHFNVEAKDSEGLIARGPLDITVQQHRSGRTVNHQFVMGFRLNKSYEHAIDWQIRALEGIVNLFRDTDMDHLTVLNATRNGDMCEFVWTNDTLPKDSACPREDIDRLMKILESETEAGSPSSGLTQAMSPELKVASVSWRATGRCATGDAGPVATRQPDTYPPVTRNQVDHITATAGHLLVYKVPEDTFFDPEDGGTRNLALSLRYSDRSELMPGHWLQFDARNQEFYGLPAPGDEGVVHYQLIAEDSSKKSAYDSLIVEVVKAPTIRPTVEFQMTMEYPFPELAYNTNNKRKVVEKLAALFGQKETDNIRIQSITEDPTTIVWYNTSLPMDRCPKKEIEELRKMIIVDSRTGSALKENVDLVFDKDLKVMSIRLLPFGLCADQNTKVPKTITPVHTGTSNLQNNKAGGDSGYSEYLVTFVIPAVVIVCMILVAGLIACVLYRRRRTAKMTISDEEERQAFRSKGIPVIFQDELEERTDTEPVHKSPVIMREEKPPLLPPAPDYRSADDVPYRPPPPFAASRTPPRPKATPTYRKPPPYVPP